MRTMVVSFMLAIGLVLLPRPTFAACTYRCQPYCLWECTAAHTLRQPSCSSATRPGGSPRTSPSCPNLAARSEPRIKSF